jgi:hypothetical protein
MPGQANQVPHLVRPGMAPQRIGGPQTIMLARPGHPGGAGNLATMPGVGRPQQTIMNNMMIGQTGAGGIRVQGPGVNVKNHLSSSVTVGKNKIKSSLIFTSKARDLSRLCFSNIKRGLLVTKNFYF